MVMPMTGRERVNLLKIHSLVEQDVVLRTHSQVLSDVVHVGADVISVDESYSGCRWEQSCQNGPADRKKRSSA